MTLVPIQCYGKLQMSKQTSLVDETDEFDACRAQYAFFDEKPC